MVLKLSNIFIDKNYKNVLLKQIEADYTNSNDFSCVSLILFPKL